jgi:co-chaperonin GroES (HSP10)
MAVNINNIKANGLRAIGNRVLVKDMYFGEQKTAGGIIIGDDDGKTRGIYPRWGKVYDKGPDNNDDYKVGQWILVEHGRWTRSIKLEIEGEEIELRMVEAESVLAYSDDKPDSVTIGAEYGDAEAPTSHRPEDFVRT